MSLTVTSRLNTSSIPRFSSGVANKMPFSVFFEENQVLNRQFIELGGYLPSDMLVARNKFERYEKLLDHAFWLLVAVTAPVLLGLLFTRKYTQSQFKAYRLKPPVSTVPKNWGPLYKLGNWLESFGKPSPLQIPFEWLDKAGSFTKDPALLKKIASNLGLKGPQELEKLLRKSHFRHTVLKGKLIIVLADLALMASNSQFKLWFKNAMTAILAGKEGFSGTFNYAKKNYLESKNADYQANKKTRLILSLSIAALSVVGLPLFLLTMLNSKAKMGQGLLGHLKRLVPAFNYSDAIYMSKWVFLWYSVLNYVIGGALSARDSNERREHLVKALSLDFFFVIGDVLFGFLGAKALSSLMKKKLMGVNLVDTRPGRLSALPLKQVFEKVNGNRQHPAYIWANRNYWAGLIATTMGTALSIPLWNNWYTKQKVLREQNQVKPKSHPQPYSPSRTYQLSAGQMARHSG